MDICRQTFVYSYINGKESVSWMKGTENEGMKRYLSLREDDRRLRPVESEEELFCGDIFYFTCIGEKEELLTVYESFKDSIHYTCILQQELYREEYWDASVRGSYSQANIAEHINYET